MRVARAALPFLLTLFLLGVAVQFFLAGLGAFKAQRATDSGTIGDKQFADYFDPHRANGNVLIGIALLVLITTVLGRMGRRWILVALSLPILVELQFVFADNGPSWFRALHVLNAFVIAGVAGTQTGIAWREARTGGAEPVQPHAQSGSAE